MVRKLIILGIDGMDRDVLLRYRDDLPTLSSMLDGCGAPHLRSVFPADTTPAWSTIYTGLDPSEHGIINFVNVGAKNNTYKPLVFDDGAFRGRTFWDVLNSRGLSTAVILPMNIKEGWDIDGLMITRPYEGRMNVYPKEREGIYSPRADILGTEGKFTSEKDLAALRDEFFAKVHEEMRLCDLALENEDVDVLFSYFSTTDGIEHDFWRHCDPSHPEYPGDNEYMNTIRDMYIEMDRYTASVIERFPDVPIIVLSDHGHGARPVYTVRINELLRRGGYLVPAGGDKGTSSPSAKKKIKRTVKRAALGIVRTVGMPKWAMKLARCFPVWKSLFASSADFDWSRTRAYLSDLSALKNYSYGGVRLSEDVQDKDALADEIIEYLRGIEIESKGKPLFEWIVRTNTFYHGEHLDRYPEIIYQMDERFGGEWELGENVFERGGFMYTLSPGGHRWRTAALAVRGVSLPASNLEMTDIYGIIMKAALSDVPAFSEKA